MLNLHDRPGTFIEPRCNPHNEESDSTHKKESDWTDTIVLFF